MRENCKYAEQGCDRSVEIKSARSCRRCYQVVAKGREPKFTPNRGARVHTKQGYIKVYDPEHPMARGQYVLEHRMVMSDALGRMLVKGETVHHKNGDRSDNRLENLELWSVAQPAGQSVDDKVQFALEILRLYKPKALASEG